MSDYECTYCDAIFVEDPDCVCFNCTFCGFDEETECECNDDDGVLS